MLHTIITAYFAIGVMFALWGIFRIVPDFCDALCEGWAYIFGSVVGILIGTFSNLFLWPIGLIRAIFMSLNEHR